MNLITNFKFIKESKQEYLRRIENLEEELEILKKQEHYL